MAEVEITCADCGTTHVAKRRHAKYCPSCRLLRVLLAAPGSSRGRVCGYCTRRFRPMQKSDWACSHCRQPAGDPVVCAFCKRDGPPPLPKSPVRACLHCVKDMKASRRVIAGLRNGQDERTSTNRGTDAP